MQMKFLTSTLKALFLALLAALLTTGCASKTAPPVFYPDKPDPPRFQYLHSYSSKADLTDSSLGKALAEGALSLQKPFGVAFHKKTLLVTDSRLRGYAIFDFDKEELSFVSQDPDNSRSFFVAPFGIAVDEDGTRYIADRGASRVAVYSADNRYLRSIDFAKDNSSPVNVEVSKGKLYVSQILQSRIDIFDLKSGEENQMLQKDTGNTWPIDIAIHDDHLYVSNILLYQVVQFNSAGEKVQTFGSIGDRSANLARPKGVTVDKDGNVMVVDSAFGNFQIWRKDGQMLLAVSEGGIRPQDTPMPADIAISYELAPYFQKYAAPGFKLEYVVAVANQAPGKVNIYGFGKLDGADYKN